MSSNWIDVVVGFVLGFIVRDYLGLRYKSIKEQKALKSPYFRSYKPLSTLRSGYATHKDIKNQASKKQSNKVTSKNS